jgi:tRNA nucleotidyltransferase/poly(A) polymerase
MTAKSFHEYRQLREADENKSDGKSDSGGVGTKVSLGDNNDYVPFEVSDDPKSEHYGKNKNLAPIVRAFKGGGNWGWSKDEGSGDDKPVKIGTKKLYLVGGAVRSHLAGEKARNVELATSGSPDEVYHLLKQNGFEFVDDAGKSSGTKSPHPNRKEGSKQLFWVDRANKNGRPFKFGLSVNEDEFELEVFTKTPKGTEDGDLEPGNHSDDANSRDFTMNGMYLALNNENGPNKELQDFHGGIHHMKAGKVVPIGDMGEGFKKDPKRLMRYMRFMHGYGDKKTISSEDRKTIANSAAGLGKVDRKYMMGEFKKGMDKEGKDGREFINLLKEFPEVLNAIFPNKMLDTDLPKELSELGDKQMTPAWMLRMNDPDSLDDLDMDKDDLKKIKFLIKSLGMTEDMDGGKLDDLMQGYTTSGVSGRKLRDWGSKVGGLDPCLMDAFVAHAKSPRIKLYTNNEESGGETINNLFADLIDPFTGKHDHEGIKERQKHMELDNFRKHMTFMRPM